jgi:hypothetical protein
MAASLHEVRYGDAATNWVPSSQQVVVTSGGRSLNAWIAIDPGCAADPQASAAFVVTQ